MRRVVQGRTLARPRERKRRHALGCCCDRDLVEGRVGNRIGFHLGSSLNHSSEQLCYFRICSTVVSFRVLCCVPHADSERFYSSRINQRDLVLESFLLTKQGKNVLFDSLSKFRNAVWL